MKPFHGGAVAQIALCDPRLRDAKIQPVVDAETRCMAQKQAGGEGEK